MLTARDSRPQYLDTLGRLCVQGREVSSYLFQVPSDEEQAHEIRVILRGVIAECERTSHNELPRIAAQMLDVSNELPSIAAADGLMSGFDRMVRLWEASRSGLF